MILILLIIYLINYFILKHKHKSFVQQDDDLLNLLFSPVSIFYNIWYNIYGSKFKHTFNQNCIPVIELRIKLHDCVYDKELLRTEMKKWLTNVAKIDSADIEFD